MLYERSCSTKGAHRALKACSHIDFVRCICDVFPLVDGKKLIFKNTYFEKYLRMAASEDLSGAAILTFRRYFRKNSLSAFCKIGAVKTSAKFLGKHICWSPFSLKLQTNFYEQNFYEHLSYRSIWGDCFWYLENLTFKQIFSLDQYCWHATFDE